MQLNYAHVTDERLDRVEDLLNQIIANDRRENVVADTLAVPTVHAHNSRTNSSLRAESSPALQTVEQYAFWTWGGKMRPIPQDYDYPKKIPLKTMHDLWHEGVPMQNIRPFKFIKGTLLRTKVEAQAQCRAKVLVTEINKYLAVDYTTQTAAVRDATFKIAFDSMVEAFSTECDTTKKADHSLSYTTLYEKYYVPYNKKRKQR